MTKRSSLPLLMTAAGLLGGLLLGARMWLPKDRGMPLAAEPAGRVASAPAQLAATLPAAELASMPVPDIAVSGAAPAARVPLDAALRSAWQSKNYRQYVQQALANPTPLMLRAAWDMTTLCRHLAHPPTLERVSQYKLAPSLQAELDRRKAGCEQSMGPDLHQLRALSAVMSRDYAQADELLVMRMHKGTKEELALFYRLGDTAGMAAWGLASTPEHLMLMIGEEEVFIELPSLAPVHNAWQAAVCERFGCDDFNARLFRCRDNASCQMTLQDIFKEASGLDDAAWQQVLEAARRRVKALLPA